MNSNTDSFGIYLITNEEPFATLQQKISVLCQNNLIELLQYRRKSVNDVNEVHNELNFLKKLCDENKVNLIINDDIALAKKFNVGVHLGQSDGSLATARAILGKDALIGSTCHQSLELAKKAEAAQASYIAFGAYNNSASKPNVNVLPDQFLDKTLPKCNLPVCVIGGITTEDLTILKNKHVRYAAMINGLLSGSLASVEKRAQTLISHGYALTS